MAELTAGYARTALDLGTGDGAFVLRQAAARPDLFVVGIDANAASMREASRRAAGPGRRGGLPNALFAVAAAESLPPELKGFADHVTVHFPWGSLLRGIALAEPSILAGLADVTRRGGTVSVLLSVTDHDREAGIAPIGQQGFEDLPARYADHGLALIECRPASSEEIQAAHSSWAKRLAVGRGREAWLLRFKRS